MSYRFLSISALFLGLCTGAQAGLSMPSGCTDLSAIPETPLVDFESQIQPLFNSVCANCHAASGAAGLDLRPGESHDNLVGVFATMNPSRMRAEPFNADDSVLLLAVNCDQPGGPSFRMPGLSGPEDAALIRDWINQGAWPEPKPPAVPADVALVQVHPPGSFPGALGLVNADDGSDRIFVIRQGGVVEAVDENGVRSTFIDLSNRLVSVGEQGLLGLAFHPDFADNGRFFVNYSAGSNHPSGAVTGATVISEFMLDANGNGDPDSERFIMTVHQDFTNHNGGTIKFGPDGHLYIGMGDGGNTGDPCNRSQTLDPNNLLTTPLNCSNNPPTSAALLGKMLRIDIDRTTAPGRNNLCAANADGSAAYAIPEDNPFQPDGPFIFADRFEAASFQRLDGPCGEIWSYGLRNPWRWSFDRATGDMWIADVGQNRWEEINFEPAGHGGGADYGWKLCEASYTFPPQGPAQLCAHEHSFPVLEYPINGQPECSVTGGYRYRGPVTSLQGLYIFGDFCSGRIWFGFQVGPNSFESLEFVHGQSFSDLRSFGEDEAGNVYVINNGGIWRFTNAP